MKSIVIWLSLLSVALITGCGNEYPLTNDDASSDSSRFSGSNSADTFVWSGEKSLSSKNIPVGATYWCAPGTQLLIQDNATISVRGALVFSGTADSPVRIFCPASATFSIFGKVKAAHLISSGNNGTLFTGSGGSCILDNIEVNGYTSAVGGSFTSLTIRNATFNDNDAAVSLAPSWDYSSNASLSDLTLSGVRITGGGRQTGTGLSLGVPVVAHASVLVQQALFSNLRCAVSYAVSSYGANGALFTAVNVTVKNCIDGLAPLSAQSTGFDTMAVSNSDISTRNPAIALNAAQAVKLLIVENSNVLSKTGPPMNVASAAATKVNFNQAALLDNSGNAYSESQVFENVANSENIVMLALDSVAQPGRGMGYDFTAVDSIADTGAITPVIPTAPIVSGAAVGDGSVTVSWLASAGVSYNLYYTVGETVDSLGAVIPGVESPKTVTGLANNTKYTFAVRAVNSQGKSPLSSPVTVKPLIKPSAPAITAATASDGAVTISWNGVPMADSFNLYYAKGSAVDKSCAGFSGVTSPKTVTGLTNGVSYAFALSAVNSIGESDLSPIDSAIPQGPLGAPVISAATVSDGSVTLTWNPVSGATAYNVYYAASAAVSKSDAKIADATSPKTITGLSNGAGYAFALSAVNGSNESALSAAATATPQAPPVVPAAPAGTAATANSGSVTVSWNAVAGATSYRIYYAPGTTVDKTGASIADTSSPKTVQGLSNGTVYAFAVSAVNAAGESEVSPVATATPAAPPVPPPAPTGVAAGADNGSVTVGWNAVTGATSYKVYYAPGTTVDKTGASFIGASSPKSVQGLSNGMIYAFAVCAVNAAGESDLSTVVTAMPVAAPGTPVITAAVPADSTVTVSWNPVAMATSYNLYYAVGSTVDKTGLKLAAVTSPFTVRVLTNGTKYAFAVAAANPSGESGLSGVRTATPGVPPPLPPTGVSAVPTGDGDVTVQWNPVSGATSYNIYYSPGTTVDTTGTKAASATSPKIVSQLTQGVQWAFCVSAVNAGGQSAASTVATATPTSSGGPK